MKDTDAEASCSMSCVPTGGLRRSRFSVVSLSLAIGLGLMTLTASAIADEQIKLSTGEVLTVKVLEVTDTTVKFVHPVLGELTLPRTSVEILPPPSPVPATAAPAQPATTPPPEATAQPPVQPPTEPSRPAAPPPPQTFLDGWKGKIEFGLNGSDGNSQNLSFRGGVGGKRVAETMETTADLNYIYATSDGDKSKSRGELAAKNDWLFKDSPWGFFIKGGIEYDEFQDWRWRTSVFAGPSYTFIKDEKTTLRVRGGAGLTKEFGGSRNELIPEGLLGVDFTRKLTDRQSIFVSAEWLPSLSNWPEYRANAKAGYEIIVDPETKMFLKLGLNDRYDSNPGPTFKRNDIEYFAVLGWEF